jgi:DNA topoisomerase VI subunit B
MPPITKNQKLKTLLRENWYNLNSIQYVHILTAHQIHQKRARKPKIITVIIMRKRNSNQLLKQLVEKMAKVKYTYMKKDQLRCNGREHLY